MKKTLLMTSLIAGTAMMSLSAMAQTVPEPPAAPLAPEAPPSPMHRLLLLDTNGDDQITRGEVDAGRATKFAEIDADNNGFVSADEITAHRQAHMAERQAEHAARHAEHASKRQSKMMRKLDTDKDGQLSQAEFMSHDDPRFNRIDRNSDGVIDSAELEVASEHMKKKKRKYRDAE